jgi:L-asparaginase II
LLCGLAEEEVVVGVDGCGVPTFGVPLRAAATAFARLARPDNLPASLRLAVERVRAAMWTAPAMVSAEGAFNSALLLMGAGRLVAKGGAEGLFCVGDTGTAQGLAVKAEDGSGRGMPAAVVSLIAQRWGGLPGEALLTWQRSPLHNARGEVVGTVEPSPELLAWAG